MADWQDVEWEDVSPDEKEPDDAGLGKKVKQAAKDAYGGLEATATMMGGLPATIHGGLSGLGTLMLTGDIGKAGNEFRRAQESNFGLGLPTPYTESGKLAEQAVGQLSEAASDLAGRGGQAIGGDLGEANARVVAGIAGAFAPIPGGKAVRKIGKNIEKELGINQPNKSTNKVDTLDQLLKKEAAWEDVSTPKENTWMESQLKQSDEMAAREQAFADKNNIQGELDLRSKQMPVDENGMPVDMARSLDAQEAGMGGQHDLFNEEFRAQGEQLRAQQLADAQARERAVTIPEPDMAAKAAEMEKAYEQRQQQLFEEVRQEKLDKLDNHLMEIEQQLREAGITPKGDGQGPKTRAFNRGMSRREGGAIDVDAISDGFKQLREGLLDEVGYLARFRGTFSDKEMTNAMRVMNDPSHPQKIVFMSPEEFHNIAEKRVGDFQSSTGRRESVREGLKSEQGLDDIPYLKGFVKDGEFKVTSHNGRHRMDVFQEQGLQAVPVRIAAVDVQAIMDGRTADTVVPDTIRTQNNTITSFSGMSRRQRGAVDVGSPEPKKGKLSALTPDSPEVVAAKDQLAKETKQGKLAAILKDPLLDAYTTRIDTPEKVVALAPSAKDLGPTQAFKARTMSPGMNSVAISSNNPLLRFVRDMISKVIRETDQLTREYVTGPNGFGNKLKKLSQEEKNDVVAALRTADRKQKSLTSDMLKEAGFNEKQIDLIQHIQKMDEKKLEIWNKARADVGLEPVKNRQGHFAANFSGDYRTLVLDKDKNIVGFIGTTTKLGNEAIKKQVSKKDPSLTFAPTKRMSLGGSSKKMAMFEGLQDIVSVLAKNDPRFADIQAVVDAAIKDRGDSLYGAALHDKQKKGIWGNDGNKFWEDKNTNTNEALKSFIDYWEGGIASHMNLPTEVQLKGLMDNPALDHMPRAKAYVNDYINNFTGRNLGTLGDALNTIIDTPARLTGIGPSMTREAVNQFNKRASQFTMGFVNPLFLATQYLQVLQTGMPELVKLQTSLGLSPLAAETAMGSAVKAGLKLGTEKWLDKPADVSPLMRDAFDYAKDNGLLAFSEYVNAQDIFQNKYSKGFDKVADKPREIAEKQTRPLVFLAAVEMLKDSGMPKTQIFDTAYNITQHSMVNYHTAERPLMYSRLGVLGHTAGSLQTFKHAFLGQLGTMMKDAMPKKMGGNGRPAGMLAAGLAILAFSGIRGVPFYSEADEMFKAVSDKFFKDRKSIADVVMENWPEFLKSGALSDTTGVNMQSRMSAADVLPNSPVEAVSPFASWGGRIATGVGDVVQNNDQTAWGNLATAVAPSGTIKGLVENTLKSKDVSELPPARQKYFKDPEHFKEPRTTVTLNRDSELDYPRSEKDTNIRKWTGGSSLDESLNKAKQYDQMINARNRREAQGKITEQAKRQLAQGTMTQEKMKEFIERYKKEKGDPMQLVAALQRHAVESKKTTKERLQGTPGDSLSSIYRYQNYD